MFKSTNPPSQEFNDGFQQGLAAGRVEAFQKAIRACEKRAEERFHENGITEWDTGATSYGGSSAEEYETRDEEDAECAEAIRALMIPYTNRG